MRTSIATQSTTAPIDALRQEADSTALQHVDEAHAAPRPGSIERTYKELEFDERTDEQVPLHDAEGEVQARQDKRAAAGLEPRKATAEALSNDHLPSVTAARERFDDAVAALGPFRVRSHRAKLWYSARTVCLFAGDVAGISGAAISLGELPVNAFLLAGSASVTTIAAGMVGKDVRTIYLRHRRAAAGESLSETQKPFRHLFEAAPHGLSILRGVVLTSAAVGIVIGLGIYGLRTSIEGSLSGLVFGTLAVAVVAGSFLSSYAYGDDISDVIEAARHDYHAELRQARRLARSWLWARWKRHDALATSIAKEHTELGRAAQLAVTGAKWRLLSRNPSIVGHGPTTQTVPIGRRTRGTATGSAR